MKTLTLALSLSVILSFAAITCSAQTGLDSTMLYRVETLNGNEFIGNILIQDSMRVLMKTNQLGEISILNSDIRKMDRIGIQQIKYGKYWYENPQSSRYFWAPNGYGLKAGEAYYQNVWVLYNQVSVGLTDNISIGAGTIPLFLFAGTSTPVWVIPKVSFPIIKDKLNLGAGAVVGTILGETPVSFGIVYGVSTFGNRDNNVSLGLGYGFAAGEWADIPLFELAAMFRVSDNTYLITENYFISIDNDIRALLGFGGRSIIRRSAGIDYGLAFPLSAGNFIAIPWLGITVPFGKGSQPDNVQTHRIQ